MAILVKAGGAYAAVDTIYHKAAGVYSPVEGVFSKNAGVYESIGGGGGALPGLVAMFHAGNYSSGQLWTNEVAAPADGSLQADHDWWLGRSDAADGFDPTFTAGPPAYFTGSGGKIFSQAKAAAANVVNFYRNMHHAGTKFSILAKLRWTLQLSGDIIPIFDSGCSDQGGGFTSRAVTLDVGGTRGNPAGRMSLNILRDSGGTYSNWNYTDTALPDGVDVVVGVSFDGTNAVPSFFFKNDAYWPVNGGANTFAGTLTTPGSLQTTNRPAIAARADFGGSTLNFARFHSFAIFNTNLTLEQMIAANAVINPA